MKKRSTIYDIAKAMNIAPATVSRALNNHPNISDTTKKRVAAMAVKMNYRINTNAANLRTGGSKTIGVIVPKINNYFFSNVIAGIQEIATQHHYHIVICQTDECYDKEVEHVNMLIRQNVAAIILSITKETVDTKHLKEAIKQHIPVIQFDRTDASIKGIKVTNNNTEAAEQAVKHLYEQGYRSIGFITGPAHMHIFKERFAGFKKGLKAVKLELNSKFVITDCLTKEAAFDATLKLLQLKKKPDAILASTDLTALGAMLAAKSLHIKIPEELGICGFSNEAYTELTSPSMTTIEQHSIEMGRTAARLFFENSETKNPKEIHIVLQPELIVRASTKRK